jgi:hypothetical protein
VASLSVPMPGKSTSAVNPEWDPDRLMQLYKKAGAKYFVSMGTLEDNFFLWNPKLHKWNAVNMGPKPDVVGVAYAGQGAGPVGAMPALPPKEAGAQVLRDAELQAVFLSRLLLGYDAKVQWQQTGDGLILTLPQKKISEFTCGLKFTGTDLKPEPTTTAEPTKK